MSAILVVGSVGYDTISTPKGERAGILGGSANYFSLAAAHCAKVRVVGVVGDDYRAEDRQLLTDRGVDIAGLQTVHGETFRWSGKYEKDMNEATTLATHLNVFENFHPAIPMEYRDSKTVFLANIDPVLQLQVLEQVKSPRLIAADTMNYWISSKKADLLKVLERINILMINESEIRQLTGNWNCIQAAKEVCRMGPRAVVIKRGEYGFMMYTQERFFILPAFPVENVVDPTGAGDTFAGGFLGHLAQLDRDFTREDLKLACVNGCLMASFTVQDFGVEGIRQCKTKDLDARLEAYRQVIALG
jgi:sugar/nucleoside kinase (ribokinase family)